MNGVIHFANAPDGTRLAYYVDGPADAPPLLFAHSLGVDAGTWAPQVRALSGERRIVRYDARGHGHSDAPAGASDIALLARDALAVLDAAGVDRADMVGLSMGGMVGMWLAVHAPQRLRRLVLANTAAHIPLGERWNQLIATAQSRGMGAIARGTLERWVGAHFKAQEPAAFAALVAAMEAMSAQGYAGCVAALRDADLRDELSRIALAVRVLTGADDLATPPAAADALAAAIPGARALVLAGAGHLSNIEQPEAFNDALRSFLI